MPIITLTTDFGNDDPFDGVMKGVILGICPQAEIIDLTHNISPQDIYQANFILQSCYQYFPKGTIHICVVDPGVDSLRKPILIELTEKKYWLPNVSQTFHGRDIFAPVAAYLAKGEKPINLGKSISKDNLVRLPTQKLIKNENGYEGIVQYLDHFGNIITNIPNKDIKDKITGKVKNFNFDRLVSNFAEGKETKLTALKGSSGYIELFVYKNNAAKLTSVSVGDIVDVKCII